MDESSASAQEQQSVRVPVGSAVLDGDLVVPEGRSAR